MQNDTVEIKGMENISDNQNFGEKCVYVQNIY